MSLEDYKRNVEKYRQEVQKVILLGGEPTIHPELEKMLDFNKSLGLRTTIYTNGFDLGRLEKLNLEGISIRVGVYGCENTEKPISRVDKTDLPLDIVYMLRRDNVGELMDTAERAEKDFNCVGFYISSIRDIDVTGSFWKDTPETISVQEYAEILKNFVKNYKGNIPVLHIARRGVLYTKDTEDKVDCCRFGNIFPDGQKIICPFDISRNITSSEIEFNKRRCNKNTECILRKIVLKRI
jgi:MoaA/NifB/PqqE/SkfB family radical SAM enzyme